jgi:AraC family transcriptional regulator of adaptative response/methylated-DNA-[protein]-cysteine methyltransferase
MKAMTDLHYSIATSYLGLTLMAYTRNGVNLIMMGDHENELLKLLEGYYPPTSSIREAMENSLFHRQLLDWIEYPVAPLNIPLERIGTPFQFQVWTALCAIPPGETRSYQAIASNLGKPDAARAVANACAANRLAPIIPCHRVIRSDGSLSGYRWGITRKKALLEREASICSS